MKKRNKKAQIAMEYMMIIGFAFLTSIILFIVFYEESNDLSTTITDKQVEYIAKKVANYVDKVYYLGENSKTTLKIYLPSSVINATVENGDISITTRGMKGGESTISLPTVANTTGRLPYQTGTYYVTIESIGDQVLINYT